MLNFSNIKSVANNQLTKAVSYDEFERVLVQISTIQDQKGNAFYLNVAVNSLWASAVAGVYYGKKDLELSHAPSYIINKEAQIDDSVALIHWLAGFGFQPDTDNNASLTINRMEGEITFEDAVEVELKNNADEYKEHGVRETMSKSQLQEAYQNLPQALKDKVNDYAQAIYDNEIAMRESAFKSSIKLIESALSNPKDVKMSGEFLYKKLIKLQEKFNTYVKNSKTSLDKARRTQSISSGGNNPMLANSKLRTVELKAVLELLDNIIKKADEIDNSFNTKEVSDKADELYSSNLDEVAGFQNKDYNEGYIV